MSLFRSTNGALRFGSVIELSKVDARIMRNKKVRQRYLDFAFRKAVRACLEDAIRRRAVDAGQMGDLIIHFDVHRTATAARYELQESLSSELRDGGLTPDGVYVEPRFPGMGAVKVRFVDSRNDALVRASDVIANVVLHKALEGDLDSLLGRLTLSLVP